MARSLKYPVRYAVRVSEETDKNLQATAKIMGLQPAVAARVILEANLRVMPSKDLVKKFAKKEGVKS